MSHGMRWVGLDAARVAAKFAVRRGSRRFDEESDMSIVMGLDQHRAQITAEWLDTDTGEVSRSRIVPADRSGVRKFLARFGGRELEVALEATTGWRFVVEELRRVGARVHLASRRRRARCGEQAAREERSGGREASAGVVDGRPAAGVLGRAGPSARSPRSVRLRHTLVMSAASGSSGCRPCSTTTGFRSVPGC